MKEYVYVKGKENVNKSIKAIGQSLLEKADEITNDLDKVSSITIHAELNLDEIVNFDVTKNYLATFEDNK